MESSVMIPHIEALVFASEKPLATTFITDVLNQIFQSTPVPEDEDDAVVVTQQQVQGCIDTIKEKYQSDFYSFSLQLVGGGYQFLTKPQFYKTISLLNKDKYLKRLSNAALETLSIIAYKQPISKGEIENIRAANSDYSVQKLLEKDLIVISGRNEQIPGHPILYSVSQSFMDYFGINSIEELPKVEEILIGDDLKPTVINPTNLSSIEEDAHEKK
ncbi:MAG: SMC-Scp complex subunit ScpB [Phycisphaerales bacterium]|nr:SMC-Scp complex subunit ScpB [Phycisphaerales bacterium]